MDHRKKIAVFLAKFFAIFALSHYLLLTAVDLTFMQEAIAQFQAGLLGISSKGISIFVDGGAFLIVISCTGLVSAIILGSIIFSLKKPPLKEKIVVFSGGTIVLFLVNQARLFLVLLVGKNFGLYTAEWAHIISWFATTAAIIIAWYYFTKKLSKTENFEGFL